MAGPTWFRGRARGKASDSWSIGGSLVQDRSPVPCCGLWVRSPGFDRGGIVPRPFAFSGRVPVVGLIIVWVTSKALFLQDGHEKHEGIQGPSNNGLFSVPPWCDLFAVAETLIMAPVASRRRRMPAALIGPEETS